MPSRPSAGGVDQPPGMAATTKRPPHLPGPQCSPATPRRPPGAEFVAAAAAAAGPVDVTVITPGGTSTALPAGRYTYAKDTTKLTADPLLVTHPGQLSISLDLSATPTDTGKPCSGATIKSTAGLIRIG
ncbi:hypothetical protein ACIRBY_32005 [Streptomyces sp. NPDC096136]|uniref:hypothetical protein n=1 Tax=Streptomyces sp. NPDC096136 TaxID=3366076 RepID=UPI0038275E14